MEYAEYVLMDAEEQRLWWYRALHARLVALLAGVHGRVVDAGCGTGGLLQVLAQARPDLDLLGVEFDAGAARLAARKSGVAVLRGSVNAMPLADGCADAAIAADVLCHAAVEPMVALGELRRVVRPGGLVVLNMPAYRWMMSAHDRRVHNARRVTPGELRQWLLAAGLVEVRTRFWNSLLFPLMVAQRKLLARGDAASDVAAISPWLNASLLAVTRLEWHLPALPVGGSILATARVPGSSPETSR